MKNLKTLLDSIIFSISVFALGVIVFNNSTQAVATLKTNAALIFPLSTSVLGALVYSILTTAQRQKVDA